MRHTVNKKAGASKAVAVELKNEQVEENFLWNKFSDTSKTVLHSYILSMIPSFFLLF